MTHPNEMAAWDEIGCVLDEPHEHGTRPISVRLGGQTPYHDYTPIPERFAGEFVLEVWEWDRVPWKGSYCPARDVVSQTIQQLGIWEPCETATMLCIFELMGGGTFIDFGAQLGWFSILAARAGMQVVAIEADHAVVEVLNRNLKFPNAAVVHQRVGPDTEPFDPLNLTGPIAVKIDLEGAEVHAIKMLQPLIENGSVEYVMAEISPVFNDSYPKLVAGMMRDGFVPYVMPDKSMPPHRIEGLGDLKSLGLPVTQAAAKREVETWHQRDVLFVRGGL